MKSVITPTQHEKNEWARFADAAYASGRNSTGHRFSAAAALMNDQSMSVARFDSLQADYRAWLCFGEWPTESDGVASMAPLYMDLDGNPHYA
jgi:hypothetical protein